MASSIKKNHQFMADLNLRRYSGRGWRRLSVMVRRATLLAISGSHA
jgi:hypothetical protein